MDSTTKSFLRKWRFCSNSKSGMVSVSSFELNGSKTYNHIPKNKREKIEGKMWEETVDKFPLFKEKENYPY